MRRTLLLLWCITAFGASAFVISTDAQTPPLVLSQITWFDRAGKTLSTLGALADHGDLELSPDGTRVAVAVTDRAVGTRDIWIYEQDGMRTRMTSDAADENWLIWSPDGQRVAINSFTRERLALLQRPARGSVMPTDLLTGDNGMWPVSWSPDGQNILYVTSAEATGNDIWVLPLGGGRRPYAFAATPAMENWAAFSPDGRYVVYSSTEEAGEAEVYVTPFPPGRRKWRVSPEGGTQARWRRDNEIVYLAPDNRLVSASLRYAGDEVVVTDVQPLFTLNLPYGAYHAFDVTRDGQRIVANSTIVAANAPTLSVSVRP
jgi:dipeptidyl aminopeptidase/acylaminoacyl peptidase